MYRRLVLAILVLSAGALTSIWVAHIFDKTDKTVLDALVNGKVVVTTISEANDGALRCCITNILVLLGLQVKHES